MAGRKAREATGKRAAIYARFSSHNQRDESIEIQVENCRAYCEQNGLKVVGEYKDYAQTGRDTNRAGFQRMLSDAAARRFDHVVIYKVTRIMRNRDEMALARITLRKHGVDILYAGEQIGEGSSGVLQLGLLEVLAEWESAILSERVRDGIQRNAAQGKANGNTLYGWDIVGDRYVVNEVERAVLVEARDVVVAGGTVADALRAVEGHRTKRGRRFTQQVLTDLLRRPQNYGTYSYAGHVIEGGMPALWTREEQMELERRMNAPGPHPRAHEGYERFSLTGRMWHEHGDGLHPYHGTCGTSRNGRRYRYYRCRECRRSLRADVVEAEVAEAVLRALEDAGTRRRIAESVCAMEREGAQESTRADAIRGELREIELMYERAWNAIMQGIAPPGGKERMDELKDRQALLEEELSVEEARERLAIDPGRVEFWLTKMARATPEQIIELFVSRVIVHEDGSRRVILMIDEEEPPPEAMGDVRPDSSTGYQESAGQTINWLACFLISNHLSSPLGHNWDTTKTRTQIEHALAYIALRLLDLAVGGDGLRHTNRAMREIHAFPGKGHDLASPHAGCKGMRGLPVTPLHARPMARTKLTYEMVETAAELRASGLCDADVAAGIGVHRATLNRWLADPGTDVKRALCDSLRRANVGFKRTMLVAIRNASEEGPENRVAAAWLLERKWPQQYARCARSIGGEEPASVQLALGI